MAKRKDDAMFRRIAADIQARMVGGEYKPGDSLPSFRHLMNYYQCSSITISNAFKLLSDNGLIETFHGRETLVCEQTPAEHLSSDDKRGPILTIFPKIFTNSGKRDFEFITSINEAAGEHGFAVLAEQFEPDRYFDRPGLSPARLDALLDSCRVSGVIWALPKMTELVNLCHLVERGIKTIIMLREYHDFNIPSIRIDYSDALDVMLEQLKKDGIRKLGIATVERENYFFMRPLEELLIKAQDHDIEIPKDGIIYVPQSISHEKPYVHALLKTYFANNPCLDAWLAFTPYLLTDAITAGCALPEYRILVRNSDEPPLNTRMEIVRNITIQARTAVVALDQWICSGKIDLHSLVKAEINLNPIMQA